MEEVNPNSPRDLALAEKALIQQKKAAKTNHALDIQKQRGITPNARQWVEIRKAINSADNLS